MAEPLTDATRSIVKACIPALEAHGLDITREMYQRLLAKPEIRDLFNMSHQKDGEQPKALALAVLAYARHIDNPGALAGMIERIAEKHVGLNILPEHYPYVADALLGAIAHVLGDAATPEILDAWGKAYWFLADVLIGREHQIYEKHAHAPGGWTGWRDFTVRRIVCESDVVKSFELVPVDGKAIMVHTPGQYLSFRLEVPGHGSQRRNYSISSEPGCDHYRISVRRADGGVVSDWLHDTVKEGVRLSVSAPAGDFTIASKDAKKIVFLSAGIGLTPFIAALGPLTTKGVSDIRFIHGAHNPQVDAFGTHIRALAGAGKINADVFYTEGELPADAHTSGVTVHKGRVTKDWLAAQVDPDAVWYVCGPDGFMRDMIETLKASGVSEDRIHFEFFGSAADAELAAA